MVKVTKDPHKLGKPFTMSMYVYKLNFPHATMLREFAEIYLQVQVDKSKCLSKFSIILATAKINYTPVKNFESKKKMVNG